MKKFILFIFVLITILSTACGSVQNNTSIQPSAPVNTTLSAASVAPDVFFSFEEFEKASQLEKSNQYFNSKDKNHFNDLEKMDKGTLLDRILVTKYGITITYKLPDPDQAFTNKFLENGDVSGAESAKMITIKTYLGDSSNGSPPAFANNYQVVNKNGTNYYIQEIVVVGNFRGFWNIGYVSEPDFIEVLIPGNYDLDSAIKLAKTTKKSLQKLDKDTGAEPLTTTLSNETTEVSQPTEPNTDKSTEPIGTQQVTTTP
jgi:hypothetical protein